MELDRQRSGSPSEVTAGLRQLEGYWGALALMVAGVLLFAFIAQSIVNRNGIAMDPGWSPREFSEGYRVGSVDTGGAASGILRPGDRIVALNGDRRAGVYGPLLGLARMTVGAHYTLDLIRDGVPLTVTLRLAGQPADSALREIAPILFIAFLLYAMAVWIALVGPKEITARLAAISFLGGAMVFASSGLVSYPGWSYSTAAVATVLWAIWRPWHLAFGYDFLSRFPHPVPENLALRLLRWIIYAGAAAHWLPITLAAFANAFGLPPSAALHGPAFLTSSLYMTGYASLVAPAMCLVLLRNYVRLPSIAARKKMRWAGLGIACAIVPPSVEALIRLVLDLTGSPMRPPFYTVLDQAGALMVGLAPVMVAYAVVRHRVLGIHVVVRRGLQYLFARNVLRVIAFLPLLIVLIQAIRQSDRSVADLVLHSSWSFYVLVAAALGFSLRYRTQMRLWLDRKFFRVAYEQEQILAELIEQIKSAESEEEVSLVVVREVERALSVDGIHVLLRNGAVGPLRVAFSYPPREGAKIRDFLNRRTLSPPGSSIDTLYAQGSGVISEPPSARQSYREILMVPLAGTDRSVAGFLALGPKRSEEPYTRQDRDLLLAIAGQMAVMYEVLRLKQRVSVEGRMRVEVLGRLRRDSIELLNECPQCGKCYSSEEKSCDSDGAELGLTLPVERIIEGKYRLDQRIGRGGMGVVYEARDLRLNRAIAIKIMTGELFGNQRAVERFEREARTAAGLKNPNIVAIHDFGRLPAGGAYLVMELIAGRSWREELKIGHPVAPTRCAVWFEQLCAATSAAHAMGIVHRDLKPENVMIGRGDRGDRVVILDFGLAKTHLDSMYVETALTSVGSVLGTRAYMSPEQRAGEPVDVRTDVYSIGVLAVETLTGVHPPRTGASLEWMQQALAGCSAPGSRLTLVLEQAMAEAPANRLLSARELGLELVQAIPQAIAPTGRAAGDAAADTVSLENRRAQENN